jgi:hypothetical protein
LCSEIEHTRAEIMGYSGSKKWIMNNVEQITAGVAGIVIAAAASYGYYKAHRRRIRQQQCFSALQIPCPVCGVIGGAPCTDNQGAPTFLHWPRVTASLL